MTSIIDRLLVRPAPYAPGDSIWTDPDIAPNMLAAHLDASNDAASYRPARRYAIVAHLARSWNLAPGMRLLDLGCGPGLYASAFARLGVDVVGMDVSPHSLRYAEAEAASEGLPIRYLLQDYRDPFPASDIDAVTMISEDYGVLSPADRRRVLANIRAALRPGGHFALDVASVACWRDGDEPATWSAHASGFYRPHPHIVLERTFRYPELRAVCGMVAVLDDRPTVYLIHRTHFTPEGLRAELEEAGFAVEALLGDLDGSPYAPDGGIFGVIARAEKGGASA